MNSPVIYARIVPTWRNNEFKRFRIGISSSGDIDTKDYVLGKFSRDEYEKIMEIIPDTVSVLNDFCFISFEKVMSKYN